MISCRRGYHVRCSGTAATCQWVTHCQRWTTSLGKLIGGAQIKMSKVDLLTSMGLRPPAHAPAHTSARPPPTHTQSPARLTRIHSNQLSSLARPRPNGRTRPTKWQVVAVKGATGHVPLVIDEDVLIGEVVRLRKSASAGPDTITNAYIRQVMGEEDVRRTLLPFLRLVMGGAMNSRAFRIFGASRLVLIQKAGGSADYRPLGIGSALYRLLNRVIVKQVMGELKEKPVPFQLALGVRDAGAALATLAQGIFEQGRKGGLYCTDQLGLDLKNAFGTVSGVRIHETLREHCPSLLRWFLIAYGGTSPILHSTWGLMDREVEVGIKQGDPFSMLLMAVVMVRPLHVINELIYDKGHEHRLAIDGDEEVQGLNLLGARGYADDVWLHGDAEILLRHLDDIHGIICTTTGMELQPRKSVLLLARDRLTDDPVHATAAQLGVQVCVNGCVVMSVPVGTDAFVEQKMEAMVDAHIGELEAVKYFSKQLQWTLLRLFVSTRE